MKLQWESVLTEHEEKWRERSSKMIQSMNPLGILVEWLFVPNNRECHRRWAAGEIRTWEVK